MTLSRLTKFYIDEETLWLLVSQVARLSPPPQSGSLRPSPPPYILYPDRSTAGVVPGTQRRKGLLRLRVPGLLLQGSHGTGDESSCPVTCTVQGRGRTKHASLLFSSLALFYVIQDPTHEMVMATFTVGLPTPINPVMELPQ